MDMDMMTWTTKISTKLLWLIPSNSQKQLNDAQNSPQLQTSTFGDIFGSVQSIYAFIVIMRAIGFVLDNLHGIHDRL